mgnify:CR=1 FL=1
MAARPISPPSHTNKSPFLTVHFSNSESAKGIDFKLFNSNRFQYTFEVVIYVNALPVLLDEFSALPVLWLNNKPKLHHNQLSGIS